MSGSYINHKDYSIVLGNLRLPDLPKELEAGDDRFIIKEEFHVTLINLERNAKIVGHGDIQSQKAELINAFYDFVSKSPLTRYELTDDLRLVDVNGNKTIVILVKLEGINDFFAWLSKKYDMKLPIQPTHITLYTLPTDTFGIPIDSYQELAKISEPIDLPEIKKSLGVSR